MVCLKNDDFAAMIGTHELCHMMNRCGWFTFALPLHHIPIIAMGSQTVTWMVMVRRDVVMYFLRAAKLATIGDGGMMGHKPWLKKA